MEIIDVIAVISFVFLAIDFIRNYFNLDKDGAKPKAVQGVLYGFLPLMVFLICFSLVPFNYIFSDIGLCFALCGIVLIIVDLFLFRWLWIDTKANGGTTTNFLFFVWTNALIVYQIINGEAWVLGWLFYGMIPMVVLSLLIAGILSAIKKYDWKMIGSNFMDVGPDFATANVVAYALWMIIGYVLGPDPVKIITSLF